MIVRELIEILETMPMNIPVVADNAEVSEVLIREEVFYSEEGVYDERLIVKLI